MAKLNFTIPSPLDQDKTFEKIKTFLSSENDFKKFDSSVTCDFKPADKQCKINGSQFTAELTVKGKIQEILEKTVHKVLKS